MIPFRDCLKSQTAKQKACHSDVDEGFTRVHQSFVLLAQATVGVEPGKGTFDDLTPGQDLKALLPFGRQDRFNAETEVSRNPIEQLAAIGAIRLVLAQILAKAAVTGTPGTRPRVSTRI